MTGYSLTSDIEVVPVLRYRLSSAHRLARHILAVPSRTIVAVELPHFLDRHEWLSTALQSFPRTSNILVEQPAGVLACPAVPNDAVWLALWAARKRGLTFHCVDDCIPARLPDIPIPLQDDALLDTQTLSQYLGGISSTTFRCDVVNRAARILARLKTLAASGPVIFGCDWRLATALIQSDSHNLETAAEPNTNTNAAILPEDPLLLWQRGDLDDIPAITASILDLLGSKSLNKLNLLRSYVRKVSRSLSTSIETTLCPASILLDPAIGTNPAPTTTKLAKALLSYSQWKGEDFAAGSIPRFAGLQSGRLLGQYEPFPLPDLLETTPMYPRSSSELAFFTPPEELSIRRYWGPDPTPPITRSESAVFPTEDERWTVPASFLAKAEGARYMRKAARAHSPGLECDLFTPVCWWWGDCCDGDFRSVADCTNAVYRIGQIGNEFPDVAATLDDDGSPPDAFYTVAATRAVHERLTMGIWQDIACSIGLIYTGTEKIGPERYNAVRQGLQPRVDPTCDPRLSDFRLDEKPLAFAIANARDVVLLAHANGFSASAQIEEFATRNGVRIVTMPLSVMPPCVEQSIRRRIFISINMRWGKYGDRIGDRAVNWRIPPTLPRAP